MSLEDKLLDVIRRSEKYMPAELWAQIKQMMTPEAIALMATVTAAWAISHFFGVGEIADAVLLVVGCVALGASALEAGREAVAFAIATNSARKDEDLEEAAQHFGKAVVLGGVALIMALFLRGKPKVMNDMKFGKPVSVFNGPGPRNGRFFYKPNIEVGPIAQRPGFFTKGITNNFGDIVIEESLSQTERANVLLHEKIHTLLTPKFYFLRQVRIKIAMEGYNRSYLLRYLEEAIAESNMILRTKGIGGMLEGISFPVKNGYVMIAKMGTEVKGILLGPINVGMVTYRAFFSPTPPKR